MDFQEQVKAKTNDELLEIYVHPDSYQQDFVNATEQELIKRKVNLEPFRSERDQRLEEIRRTFEHSRKGNEILIVICFISALLGGLLGIIAGYTYSQSRKKDNFGNKYYVFDRSTRDKGTIMMVIGSLVLVFTFVWKLS